MWRPGNTTADYRAWLDARTTTPVEQRTRIRILDLTGRVRSDRTSQFVSGEVAIDVTRDVSRVLTLNLFDPTMSIGMEQQTVRQLPRHPSYMIRADILTKVPALGRWMQCPVFHGPIAPDGFDRQGAEVTIVAESKERLALGNFSRAHTWRRGQRVTTVVRQMLAMAGEDRFNLPNLRATLARDVTVTRGNTPWGQASRLAHGENRKLEYDVRGFVTMRRPPNRPGLTIPAEWMASPIQLDRAMGETNDRWIIRGGKPKGAKRRVGADIWLPGSHPLVQVRNGERIWRIQAETMPQLKHDNAAREIAIARRDEQIRNLVTFTVDTLCLPHLAEWDLVRVLDPITGGLSMRVRQATIPLDGSPMTIGAMRRSPKPPRRYLPQEYEGGWPKGYKFAGDSTGGRKYKQRGGR